MHCGWMVLDTENLVQKAKSNTLLEIGRVIDFETWFWKTLCTESLVLEVGWWDKFSSLLVKPLRLRMRAN